MGDLAKRWNEMSDAEKLDELRDPVITRCLRSYAPGDDDNDGDGVATPVITCGRLFEDECGLKDPSECAVHSPPPVPLDKSRRRRKSRRKAARKGEFLKTFEKLVVQIRRKAMALDTLEERAALVDKYWQQLKAEFRRGEIAADFAEVVRQCLYSETIAWHWFGYREDYPPGEGE
jgi:hypothetical protein